MGETLTAIKTIEFSLGAGRWDTVDAWLESLRWVWNEGLRMLLDLDANTAPYKVMETVTETVEVDGEFTTVSKEKAKWYRAPCCPIQWSYRWLLEGEAWIAVPYTPYARVKPYRPSCPLLPVAIAGLTPVERPWIEPRLDQPSMFSLSKFFAHKRHQDKPWLKAVPAHFIRGTLSSLAKAWERYKGRKAKQPRFKRKGDLVGTLLHEDGKLIRVQRKPIVDENGIVQRYVGRILIPKLAWFKLKDFDQRWGETKILTLKVCRRPSGYYLQLTGKFPVKPTKPSCRSLGLALPQAEGLLYVDDQGRSCFVPPDRAEDLAKLLQLQQQLARQTFLGKNWHKTKRAIGVIHERLRLRARNYLHKRTTYLTRTYGKIAVQAVKAGTVKKPAPVVEDVDPTTYAKTGAERVADFNKKRVRLRTGQFVEFLEAKSLTAGHDFRKVSRKLGKDETLQSLADSLRH